MEFGIFIQGHVPRRRLASDPGYEALAIRQDAELVLEADRHNFKYAWVSEHHFLDEYSHIAASEIILAYCGALTQNIHLGSAIWNITPRVNHPVRVAERVAMMDIHTNGRFEFGTGRGAGTREVTGFGYEGNAATKAVYDEVIAEFPKMWKQTSYAFDGEYFSVPERNVLPKP